MKILIAAGGTGGHLYPAIAVARELLDRDWETKVLFITTKKRCGVEILQKEELEFRTIAASGMKRKSFFEILISLFKLPIGFLQALFHIAIFRPNVALGAGGYVSGPVLAAAWLLRIPRLIHEQNVLPGVTNKMTARIANRIAVAFRETADYFPRSNVEVTGNPVRKEFFEIKPRVTDVEHKDQFTLLVFGGSQGSHAINMGMVEAASILMDFPKPFSIFHQTGEADLEWVKEKYEEFGVQAEVKPFIFDMFDAFRLADLIVCRAGAMTLSELAAAGRSAILIPLPTAADNHQEVNARALERNHAAEIVMEDAFLGDKLAEKISYYMENPLALMVVGEEIKKFAKPDAALRIALMTEELAALAN